MGIEEMCAHELLYELTTDEPDSSKSYTCGKCLESYVIRLCARSVTTHIERITDKERWLLEFERENAPLGVLHVFNLD